MSDSSFKFESSPKKSWGLQKVSVSAKVKLSLFSLLMCMVVFNVEAQSPTSDPHQLIHETTNNVLGLLKAGLDEFTISLHGVHKKSYEAFMKKASYEKFHKVFKSFEKLKLKYNFKVRINYTFNKDNFHELSEFFNHFSGASFDVLQIRPIQKIGNTEYNDFDLETIRSDYGRIIKDIKSACQEHKVTLLASDKIPIVGGLNSSSFIFDYTFCYISPNKFWKPNFKWREQTFDEFSKEIAL